MKSEEEIQKIQFALRTLETAPEWFIDKSDRDTMQKILEWIMEE